MHRRKAGARPPDKGVRYSRRQRPYRDARLAHAAGEHVALGTVNLRVAYRERSVLLVHFNVVVNLILSVRKTIYHYGFVC